jgi:hypothetical protein
MASDAVLDPVEEEELALALELSQISADAFDERVAQLQPGDWASNDHVSHATRPPNDDENNSAPALGSSQVSSGAFNEQLTQLHPQGSTLASGSENAHSFTHADEIDDEDVQLHLNLSQLPADIFDEQVRELTPQRGGGVTDEVTLASLRAALSLLQVRARCHRHT